MISSCIQYLLFLIDRKGLSKAPEGGYLGYRPIVDGVVGDYEWIT